MTGSQKGIEPDLNNQCCHTVGTHKYNTGIGQKGIMRNSAEKEQKEEKKHVGI